MEKQYEYQLAESKIGQKWENENTYALENNPGPLYSIDTPPPTVSGNLHIGHVFSYTQTDIIARYKRMSGLQVFYPFGFDDNGLPTERYVEKKREIRPQDVGRSEFIKLCLQETHAVEEQFVALWKKIGLSVNWNACYSTISNETRKLSQESFITLYKKGFIYRKYEPALFCTTCRTSVSQAELEDVEQLSAYNEILFKDESGQPWPVHTTRPELLAACVALIYHPDDHRFDDLKNQKFTVPLYNFQVPLIADERVDMDKGTGLVMCCTFGDKTDIEWYKKFKLPYKQAIGFDGKMTELTGPLAGLKVPQAREKIMQLLIEQQLGSKVREFMHAVNVHERCKKNIEYIALEQWFINILDHKEKFLELANQIQWYPAFMKTRYVDWVQNLSWDWCISRQRFFGIPFPVWHCKSCNHIILASMDQLPIDPQEQKYDQCPQCQGTQVVADTDVMDTWNTSSLTPYICYQLYTGKSPFSQPYQPGFLPMSNRPQAHDIIRTWAFDTIVKAWMHQDDIPWHNIVISGHVLTDSKEKISKSKENSPLVPENLLKMYPADAIRYWTASASLGYDAAFSETQLKIGLRLSTKLWNAFRFVGEHIQAVGDTKTPTELGAINQWLLDSATRTFAQYNRYFSEHEFNLALAQIDKFFWQDFCDNYLELVKNQLFNPDQYAPEQVAATRWTLYHVGLRILQMYAPYMPFLAESLYAHLYQAHEKTDSLHQTKFATYQTEFVFEDSKQVIEKINALVGAIRKAKTEKQLSLKTPLEQLTITAPSDELLDQVKEHEQLIKGVSQAQNILYKVAADVEQASMSQDGQNWNMLVFYGTITPQA